MSKKKRRFFFLFLLNTSKTIHNYCANIVFIKIVKASRRYLMKMCHDISNRDQTTGWKHINPRKVSHILGLFMSFSWIYICIEENNNRQPASPRWNTSVILFMHLSLLALLPCVLSLGGPACCAPESWHAQAEGRGSSGEGWGSRVCVCVWEGYCRRLHGHPERACSEHMQWFSSTAPTTLFMGARLTFRNAGMGRWVRNFFGEKQLSKI